jgi:four helix bundle protein
MQDYRELRVWRKAYDLALAVHASTVRFPGMERFGLTAQVRRSAVAVASDIAEGCGRGSDLDFARFLQMAMGSVSELGCQLQLARDLGFLDATRYCELHQLETEVRRMLAGLLRRLRSTP